MEPRDIYEDICGGKGGHGEGLEGLWAEILVQEGYEVRATCAEGQGGGDGGFDLKADKDGHRKIVEAKCHKPGFSVGRPEILKAEGARSREDADVVQIVTPSGVANGKERDLERTSVEFIDGEELVERLEEADPDGELYDKFRKCSDPIEESSATCHRPIQ